MKKWFRPWVLGLAVAAVGTTASFLALADPAGGRRPARPADAPAARDEGRTEVSVAPGGVPDGEGRTATASTDQLKSEAWRALREGQFDRSNELLGQAARLSADDAALQKMVGWSSQFESQRKQFVDERHKQYQKAVDEVQTLQKNHKDKFAIDATARAYLLADNKDAFRKEKWVDDIVQDTIKAANGYEQGEQWLKALRLYSELGSLDPANALWKEKLKSATRRIRLLALYNPDELKAVQEGESKEREEVEALLHPSTQPAKKPKDDKAENDAFHTDWHDTLKGINADMLKEALVDAKINYYRDANYKDLMLGGLNGVKAVLTTKGLEKPFPGLADAAKKADLVKRVDELIASVQEARPTDEMIRRRVVNALIDANGNSVNLPEEVLVNEFADGAFAVLDPFSNMIWPADLEEFNKTTGGAFSGVGIQIQSDDDGSLKVVSPLEDSPAFEAGIKAGDVITHINGKNAKGINLNTAVKTITGPVDTKVTLTIRHPDGTSKDYTLTRKTIKVQSIKGWSHKRGGGWDYLVDPDQKIAYVRITNFTKTTSEELESALSDLGQSGARGLIVDLRYNPGGLLTAATEVCDKFIKNGTIVSTRPDRQDSPNQPTYIRARNNGDECTLPVVVLVNQYSASASEIVSGALKYTIPQRALIVGERTFGKGSVQMLFPLANRTAYLKLTTSHYYLPNNRCIHREENSKEWGVDPDVTVEMTPEQMRAAIDARQELDVLRKDGEEIGEHFANPPDGDGKKDEKPGDKQDVKGGPKGGEAKAKKDPLTSDAQLSAALLILRMQLAGAKM